MKHLIEINDTTTAKEMQGFISVLMRDYTGMLETKHISSLLVPDDCVLLCLTMIREENARTAQINGIHSIKDKQIGIELLKKDILQCSEKLQND